MKTNDKEFYEQFEEKSDDPIKKHGEPVKISINRKKFFMFVCVLLILFTVALMIWGFVDSIKGITQEDFEQFESQRSNFNQEEFNEEEYTGLHNSSW